MESVSSKFSRDFYDALPDKPSPPPKPVLVLMAATSDLNADDYRHHADALDAWEKRMAEYRKAFGDYEVQREKIAEMFWRDLEEENGMVGHPKSALTKEMAVLYSEPGDTIGLIMCYENLAKLAR